MVAGQPSELLTAREREVLRELAAGRTNAEIAQSLGITFATAKWYVSGILAKLGVESREDAAAWWRRETSLARRIRRGIALVPISWPTAAGVAGVAVLAGSVAVLLAVVLAGEPSAPAALPADPPTGNAPTPVPPSLPPVLAVTATGEGWSVALAPGARDLRSALPVLSESPSAAIRFFDLTTRQWVGQLDTGYNPMVVVRPAAGELLVSDNLLRGGGFVEKRLLVFDLRNSLALKAQTALPERANTHGGPGGMVLANNERYLYYTTQAQRSDPPTCAVGGDAAVCALTSVALVDLASLQALGPKVEMPRGCGPSLSAMGPESVLIVCNVISYGTPAGQVFTLGAALRLVEQSNADLPYESEPVIARNRASASLAWQENGRQGFLYSEGTFARIEPDGTRTVGRAVPAGKRPRLAPARLADGRLAIGYVTHYYDQVTEGIAVFDPRTMRIDRDVRAPGLRGLMVTLAGAVAGLTESGEIVTVNVGTGALEPTGATLGVGNHYLVR